MEEQKKEEAALVLTLKEATDLYAFYLRCGFISYEVYPGPEMHALNRRLNEFLGEELIMQLVSDMNVGYRGNRSGPRNRS